MYVEAAKDRRELQENTITETQKQLAQLEHDTETFCADLKVLAHAENGQPAQPAAAMNATAPNATLIPVAPGNIIHSSSINQKEMIAVMMQSPNMQKLGLSSEALAVIAASSVENMLCQLQAKSMT